MRIKTFLAFLLLATPAIAGTTTLSVRDGNGVLRTFDVTTDGSGNYVSQSVICDGSAAATCATITGSNALKVDGSAVTQPISGSVSITGTSSTTSTGLGYVTSGLSAVTGAMTPVTVTITIAAPGVVSWTAHGQPAGAAVVFKTTGALPTGLTAGTIYYVSVTGLTANAFSVSTTQANALAGTNITTSGSQSGTQTGIALQTASFTPLAGRGFNITTRGTFVGTFQLERSFDGGTNWHPLTAAGNPLYVWTAPESESAQEDQFGVLYRLDCTAYTSGTINYRISQ